MASELAQAPSNLQVTGPLDFDRIARTYGAALARLAWGYAADAGDHDDLLQDILVALWRALPRFRGESSERTFVYRVAHNRAISHVARRRRDTDALRDDQLVDPGPRPDAQLDRKERSERLRAAIRRLPESQRQAVILHLEGLSPREIAALQGTTENNVGVRLTRARQALRALLGEEES